MQGFSVIQVFIEGHRHILRRHRGVGLADHLLGGFRNALIPAEQAVQKVGLCQGDGRADGEQDQDQRNRKAQGYLFFHHGLLLFILKVLERLPDRFLKGWGYGRIEQPEFFPGQIQSFHRSLPSPSVRAVRSARRARNKRFLTAATERPRAAAISLSR
ncbi:hypothetical protein SDC9_171617 [bioreactor metagenome]|uniref:Uncharacterized protein n=1 Tax=bioreactor metagenome TaxID=1076179 RepID=A0A645GKH5_9ZZZZ